MNGDAEAAWERDPSSDDERHVLNAPGDTGTLVIYGSRDHADFILSALRASIAKEGSPEPSPAVPVALAVYAGVEGQTEPDTDQGILLAIADWMDRVDDATDAEFAARGNDHRVGRTMQASLRRIAAKEGSPVGLDVERLRLAMVEVWADKFGMPGPDRRKDAEKVAAAYAALGVSDDD